VEGHPRHQFRPPFFDQVKNAPRGKPRGIRRGVGQRRARGQKKGTRAKNDARVPHPNFALVAKLGWGFDLEPSDLPHPVIPRRPRMREGQETGRARLQSCHQASRIVIPRDFSPEESASHVPRSSASQNDLDESTHPLFVHVTGPNKDRASNTNVVARKPAGWGF